jgi:hypothetical protein
MRVETIGRANVKRRIRFFLQWLLAFNCIQITINSSPLRRTNRHAYYRGWRTGDIVLVRSASGDRGKGSGPALKGSGR